MKYFMSGIFLLLASQAMVGMTTEAPTFRQALQHSLKRQRPTDPLLPPHQATLPQLTPEEVATLLEAERAFEKRKRLHSADQPTADEIAAYIQLEREAAQPCVSADDIAAYGQLERDVKKMKPAAPVSEDEIAALRAVEARIQREQEENDFFKAVAEVSDALEIELRQCEAASSSSQSQSHTPSQAQADEEFRELAKWADTVETVVAERAIAEIAEENEYWGRLASYHEAAAGYRETLSQLATSPDSDSAHLKKRLKEVEQVLIDSLNYFIQSSSVALLRDIISQESCKKTLQSLPDKVRMKLLNNALGRLKNVTTAQEKDALLAASHLVGAAQKFPQHYFTNSDYSIRPMPLLEMLISAEEESIQGACYALNNQSIIQALNKKRKQGVPITLILDEHNQSRCSSKMHALQMSGISVLYRHFPNRGTQNMHEKFMLFGNNPALGALVFHGSMNWTNNAMSSDEDATLDKKSNSIAAFSNRFQELLGHSNS